MILLHIAHVWPSTIILCVLATPLPRTKRDYQPEAIITHHSGCHLYDLNFLGNLHNYYISLSPLIERFCNGMRTMFPWQWDGKCGW